MVATAALCQAFWLKILLSEVTWSELKSVTLYVSNKSEIALMKNLIFHRCSKYIDTPFHFIRECVEKRQIVVEFICTIEQRADILTKALGKVKFAKMQKFLGVKNLEQNQIYGGDCNLINLS